jgi:hypothetical protein
MTPKGGCSTKLVVATALKKNRLQKAVEEITKYSAQITNFSPFQTSNLLFEGS